MASVGIVGGLGPESTIDYYRRILAAWDREAPATAPSIVIDSLDVQRALRLVGSDRPAPRASSGTPPARSSSRSSSACGARPASMA